jgi:DNA-3-methyladenine glycosylase II
MSHGFYRSHAKMLKSQQRVCPFSRLKRYTNWKRRLAQSFIQKLEIAVADLSKKDAVLKGVIKKVGACKLRANRKRFASLVISIISQQISVAAARTIRGRLEALLEPDGMEAAVILGKTPEELQAVGLSGRKASYVLDLAEQVESGKLDLSKMGRRSNEDIIISLCKVRGIGRWTAEMFMIFSLGRMDVLPRGDLGILNAIRDMYGLDEHPDQEFLDELEERWKPYASVASWYCWRSLDNNPD